MSVDRLAPAGGALPLPLGAANATRDPGTPPAPDHATTPSTTIVVSEPDSFGRIHSSFGRCPAPDGAGHGSSTPVTCIVKATGVLHACALMREVFRSERRATALRAPGLGSAART